MVLGAETGEGVNREAVVSTGAQAREQPLLPIQVVKREGVQPVDQLRELTALGACSTARPADLRGHRYQKWQTRPHVLVTFHRDLVVGWRSSS